MKRLRYILQSSSIIKIITIFLLILDIIYINYYPFKSKYNIKEKEFTGIVLDYELKEDKIVIIIKNREKLIVNYKYKDKVFNNLSYGDKIYVKGTLSSPSKSTNFNTFNYYKYLYNKKIYYIVTASEIKKIENNKSYLYTLKNILYRRVSTMKSSNYIKTLLLCNNSLDKEVKDSYRINGISHMFSVSGMHINFFVGILFLYLNKITYNKRIKYIFTNIFVILYYSLFPSASLFRTMIMYVLFSINFIFKLKIKKLDILFLTLFFSIIINPFIIYDLGYIYSYTISFFLVLFSNKIKGKKGISKTVFISLLSFFVSFPITIYNSYEINILSIFLNIILVPIISLIILPLTLITFIFPIFDNILYFFTSKLESISLMLSSIKITRFIFPEISILLIIIYYIFIFLSYKNLRYLYIIILFIISIYFSPYFTSSLSTTINDVGEGDSIFIRLPFNKGNILIDTGYSEYKMSNEIIPYIKSMGTKKIDYLIITHGDSDHIGASSYLINNFHVNNVIFNCGSYSDLEIELIKLLDKKNINHYSCINSFSIDKYKFYILNTRDYDNENDNSSVIYFKYNGYSFLLMGDAETNKEMDILNKYYIRDVDFLKVGHHGSKTSSSKEFITTINPRYSLISVGKNNSYGHPNKNILDNLSNSTIYRTDISGSIKVIINKNGYKIKTHN